MILQDTSSWDRNPTDVKSAGYHIPGPSSFSPLVKGFFTYNFYIYIIGYRECLILEKSYYVSVYVIAGKFPTRVPNQRGGGTCMRCIYFWTATN